jgi:hypothetical protein
MLKVNPTEHLMIFSVWVDGELPGAGTDDALKFYTEKVAKEVYLREIERTAGAVPVELKLRGRVMDAWCPNPVAL